jgi:hypothetical protein
MGDWFGGLGSTLISWVSANAVWIGVISVVYFIVSLFAVRFLIVRIPADYFLEPGSVVIRTRSRFMAVALRIGRNLCGVVVILIGLIMSVPGVAGQGFLTILLGLSLTDFPGKRTLELRIVRQPLIYRTITSIREKAGKAPLALPDEGSAGPGSVPPGGDVS